MNDEQKIKENEELEDITFVESTEDGEVLPQKDIVRKLREEIKKIQKDKEEYLTGWQRSKADYINLQRDLEQTRMSVAVLTKEKVVEELLPSLDSFEMAFSNKEHWNKIDKDWQDGITSIYQQLLSGLAKSGIEKIDQIDVVFDPNIHQSISMVPTNEKSKDHTVSAILQVGYKIGTRVIRPAKVVIFEFK